MFLVGNQRGCIIKPLYNALLHRIKFSGYRMGTKFDKDRLALEQNNYATKILNGYIVYDLDTWPKILLNNLKLKNCLFGTTNIVKIVLKKIGCIVPME